MEEITTVIGLTILSLLTGTIALFVVGFIVVTFDLNFSGLTAKLVIHSIYVLSMALVFTRHFKKY